MLDRSGFVAFGDHFASADVFAARVFDPHVVGHRRGVGEVDGDFTGFGGGFIGGEGEVAARVGFDVDRCGGAGGAAFGFFFRFFFAFVTAAFFLGGRRFARRVGSGVVTTAAGDEGEGRQE